MSPPEETASGRLDGRTVKAFGGALPGELGETLLRRHALRNRLLGILVAQLVEAEPAALDDFEAALDRALMATEKPRHLLRRFQMALGIGGEAIAGFLDRAAFADAGQHVLQRTPLRYVVEHIVGCDERQPGRLAKSGEADEAPHIVAAIEVVHREIGAALEIRRDPGSEVRRIWPPPVPSPASGGGNGRRQHDDDLTVAVRDHIGIVEMALALGRAALAESQQPREPAIGGSIRGEARRLVPSRRSRRQPTTRPSPTSFAA